MRKRIFDIIEVSDGNDKLSSIYDFFMIVVIALSLIPLAFKSTNIVFAIIDRVATAVFIIDYILRLATADFKYREHRLKSFLRYPFSLMAIIDLLSILPSVTPVTSGFKVLRILRIARNLRVFRIFKTMRYSRSLVIVGRVFRRSRDALIAVCCLAGGYILIAALIIFNVEPESFNTFFDAVYWATVSLTTVGYGDIYPVTTAGRIVTMVSSVFGIAIVALPAGIFTAGYMTELSRSAQTDSSEEPPKQD